MKNRSLQANPLTAAAVVALVPVSSAAEVCLEVRASAGDGSEAMASVGERAELVQAGSALPASVEERAELEQGDSALSASVEESAELALAGSEALASAEASADSAWVAAAHRADQDGIPVGWSGCTVDGCSRAVVPDDREGDNSADDTANSHRSRAGWPTPPDADGTRASEDDKDSTTLPRRCGCNRRDAIPSSNPIHPIPRAGQPSAR